MGFPFNLGLRFSALGLIATALATGRRGLQEKVMFSGYVKSSRGADA